MELNKNKSILRLSGEVEIQAAQALWEIVVRQTVVEPLTHSLADANSSIAQVILESPDQPRTMTVQKEAARLLATMSGLFETPPQLTPDDEVNKKVLEFRNIRL